MKDEKQFCRECNNILYPKEDKQEKALYLACKNCEHFEEAVSPVVYTIHHRAKSTGETQGITTRELASDPALRRVSTRECTRCKGRVHVYFQTKNFQNNAPLSSNYICCNCYKLVNTLEEVTRAA
ncbi:DNA-directed RNA polymerase II subunit RPB9 [Nematocida sp. LUAm2]|nr:DNA-directed RNA polymerase II subunit RPB9 [Nematocida sp. LUAm2]